MQIMRILNSSIANCFWPSRWWDSESISNRDVHCGKPKASGTSSMIRTSSRFSRKWTDFSKSCCCFSGSWTSSFGGVAGGAGAGSSSSDSEFSDSSETLDASSSSSLWESFGEIWIGSSKTVKEALVKWRLECDHDQDDIVAELRSEWSCVRCVVACCLHRVTSD